MNQSTIESAIFAAIDELNQMRPRDERLEKSSETPLIGATSQLSSLDLVNFIVATEMNLEDAFDVTLDLAGDDAISQERSPFRTVGTFTEYIGKRLDEQLNGGQGA